jgi:hypothetical protein
MTKSYYAKIRATEGVLLGGVPSTQTSRMETRRMAQDLMETVIEGNLECHRSAVGEVLESDLPAEILAVEIYGPQAGD